MLWLTESVQLITFLNLLATSSMGPAMSPNELLYLNLKLLGFEQHINKNAIVASQVIFNGYVFWDWHNERNTLIGFRSSMFDTKNPKAFQCVTHFILGTCGRTFGADQILARMKPCYPCLERSQEADFRRLAVEFFNNVEKVPFILLKSLIDKF